MKKNTILVSMLAIVLAFGVSSCDDHDHDDHDHSDDFIAPVISVVQPNQSMYKPLDTVWFDFTVTDNEDVHKIDWNLLRNGSDTVYSNTRHQHGKEIRINQTYYIVEENETSGTPFKLIIVAEDDNNNFKTENRDFTIQ
jgi:hypothetical protein